MYKTISNAIIREFKPCYDPSKVITDENEELTVKEWVEKYRRVVPIKDIIWLLVRKEFLSAKDLRLFAVWCAREALKLIENPDERIVEACNVSEKYANGEATKEELLAVSVAANDAINICGYTVAYHVYYAAYAASTAAYTDYAAVHAALAAAISARAAAHASDTVSSATAALAAAHSAQIDKLLTYF
jgi:hypothetical protein